VGVDEKEGKVREVFENVADSYDVMNDFMSAGLHRVWKDYLLDLSSVRSMAQVVNQQQQQQHSVTNDATASIPLNLKILDVAGGTGDVAFRFVDAAGLAGQQQQLQQEPQGQVQDDPPISITVCDINAEMLRVGEKRAREKYGSHLLDTTKGLAFVQGNAQDLHQFEDNTFDLYTIAFGLRNVTDVDKGLREACRVLKPGGRFMCLEFSQVPNPMFRQIYDLYSFNVIPQMGQFVAHDRDSYQYLVESIRKFPPQDELKQRMTNAGFQMSKYTNLTGGIVAIHEGWKPLE